MPTDELIDDLPASRGRPAWYVRIGLPSAVVLGGVLPFVSALSAGFTNWDDPNNILENTGYRGFSREHLQWMWTTEHLGVYEPLGWMFKAVIYAVAGLEPRAFHAASLLLHAANALMVYAIGVRLLRRAMPAAGETPLRAGAAAAALLFGLHPLRSEVVVWASGQPYLLSSFFALLATWIYLAMNDGLRPTRERRIACIMLVTLAYAMGTLSKTAALPLPAVLLVIDAFPLGRVGRHRPLRNLAMLALEKAGMLLVAFAVAVKAQSISTISNIDPSAFSLFERFQLAAFSVYFCISKTVWPSGLSAFYALPFPYEGLPRAFSVFAAIGAAMCVAALLMYRRKPAVAAAWVAFLLWLAPASGFVRHGDQYGADRYTYLSCISLAILLGGAVVTALHCKRIAAKWATVGATVGVLGVLGGLAARHGWNWCDSGRLWEQSVAADPDNWVGVNNLANYYLESGNLPRAHEIAAAGVKRWPTYHDIIMTLGLVYEQREQYRESVALFRRALDLKPNSDVVSNLAADLRKLGRGEEGIEIMRRKLEKSPNDLRSLGNLGTILTEEGRGVEAVPYLEQSLRIQPKSAELHYKLARACLVARQFEKADQTLRRLAEMKPDYPKLHYYRGEALLGLGKRPEALEAFQRAVDLDPSHVEARQHLARRLAVAGRDREAVEQWIAVLKLSPGDLPSLTNLAWLLATSKEASIRDAAELRRLAEQAVRITRGGNGRALVALAASLAASGLPTEAADAAGARATGGSDGSLRTAIEAMESHIANGKPIIGLVIEN